MQTGHRRGGRGRVARDGHLQATRARAPHSGFVQDASHCGQSRGRVWGLQSQMRLEAEVAAWWNLYAQKDGLRYRRVRREQTGLVSRSCVYWPFARAVPNALTQPTARFLRPSCVRHRPSRRASQVELQYRHCRRAYLRASLLAESPTPLHRGRIIPTGSSAWSTSGAVPRLLWSPVNLEASCLRVWLQLAVQLAVVLG